MTLTLVGTGKMALALAKGLHQKYALRIVGRTLEKAQTFLDTHQLQGTAHAIEGYDIEGAHLILLVKPYALESVAQTVKGRAHTLYSVLAGTSIEKLHAIDAEHYVRTMANLAASVGHSMTTLTGDAHVQESARAIFGAIGATLWVESEKELDIATALAGSGPAFLALIAEAFSDGAVRQGLKRADAYTLTQGLFAGFSQLLAQEHPALIKDATMSPNGTTAAGYAALEAAGVRHGCIRAIEEAYKKTL
ncbi:MAG: hypothetical protein KU37_07265 [Sulfuricurvum sp. PC08-66]|nr:MAG: hypothetical protein KU37_07265 [Sulfuricurvum sp. PC08-66]